MTVTAQSIIKTAQEQLQDLDGVRWLAVELIEHLNDGQRDIVSLRPDMATKLLAHPLVAGAKQSAPSDCSKLIEIPRNTNGAAVRQVDRNMLDAIDPSWYTKAGSLVIKHTCYDAREANSFWVYPPALLGSSLDVEYSAMPVDVAAPTGPTFSTVTGNIGVNDIFKNALLHFVMFRAWSKDAEFGGNASLSATHYQLFKLGLSEEVSPRQLIKPTIVEKAA